MKRRLQKLIGFTLIELLVVIAIIAVLAGILLPALTAARVRSYEMDCTANLKSIGQALYQYATSHDDYFPVSDTTDPGGPQRTLLEALGEYLGTNSPSWFCKRYLKEEGLVYTDELAEGRIGYLYWAWDDSGTRIYPITPTDTNNYWAAQPELATNFAGVVLASDRFRSTNRGDGDNVQYHAGVKIDVPDTAVGTLVLLSEGATMKIAPGR